MKRRIHYQILLFILSIAAGNTTVHAQEETRVLVLLSLDVTYPYVKSKVDGLAFEGARTPGTILLDIQTLEDERFTDPEKLDNYYMIKAEQLKNSKPDVIAVSGSPVIFSFYNNYIYPIMPDVPMVGETRAIPDDHKPPTYSFIQYSQNMSKTIDMALKLSRPRTVYLIGDAAHPGSRQSMQLVEQSIPKSAKVRVKRLDMPFDQLIKEVKQLPGDAVGFFSLIFSDGKGKHMIPEKALQVIADQAAFPIYAFHETMVGSGAVGGIVAKGEDVGIQMVQEAMLSLKSGPFDPPRVIPAVSTLLFDWNYIDKYGISTSKLPDGAEVVNQKPGLLQEYYYQVIAGFILIIIQSVMVALLILYSSQKKKLSAELHITNHDLERRISRRTQRLIKLNGALKRKEAEVTRLMLTDPLTGIPNRRYFENEVVREFKRADRSSADLCLAICDIDLFKSVNDTLGHDVGDIVLTHVALCISKNVRASDFTARWGGDEFVILFIDSDRFAAKQTGERVRQAVCEIRFDELNEGVTISMGITRRATGESLVEVIRRADKALYQAKEGGRNRMMFNAIEGQPEQVSQGLPVVELDEDKTVTDPRKG